MSTKTLNPALVPSGASKRVRSLALLCVLAIPAAAANPAWVQQQELTAAGGGFGTSVSVSGDTAVIGAPYSRSAGQGAAYVYVQSGGVWTLQQELTASDARYSVCFGCSVSVSGDTAVVGASDNGSAGQGTAYVFVRRNAAWSLQQELTASDAAQGDQFGSSMSLSGDTVLIGAAGKGSAYVFVQSGGAWSQQQQLIPPKGAGSSFLLSVSVSGDTALIGSPGPDSGQGAAYVFVRSGGVWGQPQKLAPLYADPSADVGDYFGWSVSVSGGIAVIGAPSAAAYERQGAAYVFVQSGGAWNQQQALVASDAAGNDQFGGSVSLSGDTAFVANYSPGVAYVFGQNGGVWSQQQKLTASNGGPRYASYPGPGQVDGLSVSGGTAVVGAGSAGIVDPSGSVDYQGAAYVFSTTQPTITGVSVSGGGTSIAQNAWVSIYGSNLAPASVGAGVTWTGAPSFASGQMPTELQSVSVTVNGKPAYIYFISATQVNVLTPLDSTTGPVVVEVNNGTATTAAFAANLQTVAPGFLRFGDGVHIAAEHANYNLLGPASMSVPGYTFTPATPGETILLFGDAFGLPVSALIAGSEFQSGALPTLPQVTIGGTPATVQYAGLISPGQYQINVVVPSTTANGDNAVVATYAGVSTPAGAVIAVSR